MQSGKKLGSKIEFLKNFVERYQSRNIKKITLSEDLVIDFTVF